MKKVLVLGGGFSSEREVSLDGAKSIFAVLKNKGYEVLFHDLVDTWAFLKVLKEEKPDVVFNALHGNFGEDGEIQGLLDMLSIDYTHSSLKSSVLGMNKDLCKEIVSKHGIKTAMSETKTFEDFQNYGTKLDFPYVVKPSSEGSSVGVFIVNCLEDRLKVFYNNPDLKLIIEQYIPGRELTVSVVNDEALAVTELKSSNDFYDYQAKYTDGVTSHILPAVLPDKVYEEALDTALKVHRLLECNTVSRSDFRYNETDGLVFLEINTNPGMTSLSLVPEQAKYRGITYQDLCVRLVENAKCRKIK